MDVMDKSLEFKCVFCKEVFDNKEDLQIHFRKHGDPKFSPSIKDKIRSQNEKSNDGELVNCDVCSDVFPTISKAITHKHKVHPEHDAKHFCPWCGKLFTMKHLYNKHMKASHVDMKESESEGFHCDSCEVFFNVPSAMLYHNKFFHRQDSELPSIGQSKKLKMINQEVVHIYYCTFCGEEYNNKVNLNKHMGDDHSDENQSPDDVMRCPLCDAIFYHLDAYELHLTFHSIEDIYSEKNDMADTITEFSLETVPPVMERVQNFEPNEGFEGDAMGIEDFLQVAMDNTASEDSPKLKSKKHKKHKKSKKPAITLDEFLSMNQDVFGEGLDFQGIEEVPSRVVAKRLKVKKQPESKKKLTKVVSSKGLDKLRKQGIVVKMKSTKNPVVTKKGKNNTEKVSDGSKSNEINANTPVNTNVVSTSNDVLSKLLNQSNQIKIVRKPAQDSLNTEHSMSDDEQHPSSPENVNILQKDTQSETEADNEENKELDEQFTNTDNTVLSTNSKVIKPDINPKLDKSMLENEHVNLPSNGTLKNLKLKSDLNISVKNPNSEPKIQTADKKETNSLSVLQNIKQHVTVKPLASPKINILSTSNEESIDIVGGVRAQEKEHVKNVAVQGNNSFKEKANPLKHLSHLTVRPVSKSSPVPTENFQESDEDDLDLPKATQPKFNEDANMNTKNISKQNKLITSKEGSEASVKSADAFKNISKNITIKTLAQSTHSSENTVREFEEVDSDEDMSLVINKYKKDNIPQNRSNPTLKTQTSEKDVVMKVNTPIKSPSVSPKIPTISSHGKLVGKEFNSCTDEVVKVKPNNADLLKHLTNITAKPVGNINKSHCTINKSTSKTINVQKIFEQKQVTNKEEINQTIEIFNIDDSDSDNEDNKQISNQNTHNLQIQPRNTPQPINALKNLSKHITVKGSNKEIIQNTKTIRPDFKETCQSNNESSNYDSDGEYSQVAKIKNVNSTPNKKILQNKLKNLGKHITIKSRNSSPNSAAVCQEQHTEEFNDEFNIDDQDNDSNSGRVKITEMNDEHDEPAELSANSSKHVNENVLVHSPCSGSDMDDDFHEESDEDFADIESKIKTNTVTKFPPAITASNDKLKNLNKNITVKSINEKKLQPEATVAVRSPVSLPNNLGNDLCIKPVNSGKAFKEVNEGTSNKCNKITGQQLMRPPNQTVNQKISACNQMNTVNKEVTVKTFQTQTVIQEITTTVTKTIKTLNQTVKQEVHSSGQSSTAIVPKKVQGMRQHLPLNKNYQGVVVRHATNATNAVTVAGTKVRHAAPVRPGPRSCNQIVPFRPVRPNNPRLPSIRNFAPSTSGVNMTGKPIKMSPRAATPQKRPTQEPSGPFSCFKKPKESLIPVSDIPSLSNSGEADSAIYFASSSQMSKSNIMNMTKTVKGNSVVSSTTVKSEVTSSQQLNRLNSVAGLKVVKTSQVKQVEEKHEVNAAKRTALEAIQKLQKQGLLVKKPRADVSEHSDHSDEDDFSHFTEEHNEYDD